MHPNADRNKREDNASKLIESKWTWRTVAVLLAVAWAGDGEGYPQTKGSFVPWSPPWIL